MKTCVALEIFLRCFALPSLPRMLSSSSIHKSAMICPSAVHMVHEDLDWSCCSQFVDLVCTAYMHSVRGQSISAPVGADLMSTNAESYQAMSFHWQSPDRRSKVAQRASVYPRELDGNELPLLPFKQPRPNR